MSKIVQLYLCGGALNEFIAPKFSIKTMGIPVCLIVQQGHRGHREFRLENI